MLCFRLVLLYWFFLFLLFHLSLPYVVIVYTEYVCNPPSTPIDCGDIPSDSISGVYTIYPEGSCGMTVYCDVETAGGPWTVSISKLIKQYLHKQDLFIEIMSNDNIL